MPKGKERKGKKMAKGRGIKNCNVLYKDGFIQVAKHGESAETETIRLYDTNKKMIASFSEELAKSIIVNLKKCEDEMEICDYLFESGIAENYYTDSIMAFNCIYGKSYDADMQTLINMIPEKTRNKTINERQDICHIGNMIVKVSPDISNIAY